MCLHTAPRVYTPVYVCVCCLQKVGHVSAIHTCPVSTDPVSVFVLVGAGRDKEEVAQGNAERVQRVEGALQ